MMKVNFTPGPWTILNGFIIDKSGREIAEVKTVCANKTTKEDFVNVENKAPFKRPLEEVEANLLLVKNAPKLLWILDAITDKIKPSVMERCGLSYEVTEALKLIVEITQPAPKKPL
jgi:hypothetical protein